MAFACAFCNRNKGSDVGSILGPDPEFHRFYNPRIDRWEDHFQLDDCRIRPRTAIGQVTERILQLNAPDRLIERQTLISNGRYPPLAEDSTQR